MYQWIHRAFHIIASLPRWTIQWAAFTLHREEATVRFLLVFGAVSQSVTLGIVGLAIANARSPDIFSTTAAILTGLGIGFSALASFYAG